VGAKGTVLRRQGGSWKKLVSGTEKDLLGIWGADEAHVVAVGKECTALTYTPPAPAPAAGTKTTSPSASTPPADFQPLTVKTCGDFYAVHGISADLSMVVGDRVMQWYKGSSLVNLTACGARMLGVFMRSDKEAVAVGEGGEVCLYQNGKWTKKQVSICPVALSNGLCPDEPMPPLLWSAWADPTAPQLQGGLVGSYGSIWMFPVPEAGPWAPFEPDQKITANLQAIRGFVDPLTLQLTLYLAGAKGTFARIQEGKLEFVDVSTSRDLNGLWVSPDGKDVYAVGQQGTIVHVTR